MIVTITRRGLKTPPYTFNDRTCVMRGLKILRYAFNHSACWAGL